MYRPSLVTKTASVMQAIFKGPGAAYGQGMQIAHILKCTKRRTFDDNHQLRTRRHVLLWGKKGTAKSTASGFFLKSIAGCVPIGTAETGLRPRTLFPYMADLKAGVSWEKLRGSCDAEGFPAQPLFPKADWVYCSELMSFLGHSASMRADRMEYLNVALEEGDMLVSLVKMMGPEVEQRREFAKGIPADAGYHYDPEHAMVTYTADFSFLGCTRPLPPETHEEMDVSGYLSRHSITEYRPTREQSEVYADDKFGKAIADDLTWCTAKNLDLWRTPVLHLNAPPADLLSTAVRVYNKRLREIIEPYGTDIADVTSGRDDMDLAQLMAASAIDTIIADRELGDTRPIERLNYTLTNVEEALHWCVPKLHHINATLSAGASEDKIEAAGKAIESLAIYLTATKTDEDPCPNRLTPKGFIATVMQHGVSRATVYRHIAKLQQTGIIAPSPTSPTIFVVDPIVMRALGYTIPAAEAHFLPALPTDPSTPAEDTDTGETPWA